MLVDGGPETDPMRDGLNRALLTLLGAALLCVGVTSAWASAGAGRAVPLETSAPSMRLTSPQTAALKNLGSAYARSGNTASLLSGWQAFIGTAHPPAGDIDALAQIVMQEASRQAQDDLKSMLEQVTAANDHKQALTAELQRVRDAQAALARGQRALPFKPSGVLPAVSVASAADLAAYRKRLEDALGNTGDDAQLANVDLQNATQKQQQLMQMLSSISKQLHDTAMATVRKIGG
jgi:hypothetical protein